MATANAAATLKRAQDFATDFATCTVTLGNGTTDAVTHNIVGWVASNNGAEGVATANAIAQETISATVNPVTQAVVETGGRTYTLTVGTSAGPTVDMVLSTLNYIAGQPSNIGSLIMRFPAVSA